MGMDGDKGGDGNVLEGLELVSEGVEGGTGLVGEGFVIHGGFRGVNVELGSISILDVELIWV